MKLVIILSLLFLSAFPAWAGNAKPCEKQQVVATVDGMVCDFCAQGLKKVLMKEDSVESVEIDLTTKHVTIELKPGQTLEDAAINKNVDWAGYKVSGITRHCAI
jgi:copper chaperone CopZ